MKEKVPSSVYGPVDSWRLGKSLGIDILCVDSICSFECVYCQLGKINRVTSTRDVFVPTRRILSDLRQSDWKGCDVITFSGSGEPTLASNLGEAIKEIKAFTEKPVVVLTNSTLLNLDPVRAEIGRADKIFCKLDAWSEEVLRRVDRPNAGITLRTIIEGMIDLRNQFEGFLAIQTMLLRRPDQKEIEKLANILLKIRPEEVQLNLPSRAIPDKYFVDTRGNTIRTDPSYKYLKTMPSVELEIVRSTLSDLTQIPIVTR